MVDFEKVFLAACNGDNDVLENYFLNGGDINFRFSKYGKKASLLAAAYRCNHLDTVEYLQSIGATLMNDEKEGIKL